MWSLTASHPSSPVLKKMQEVESMGTRCLIQEVQDVSLITDPRVWRLVRRQNSALLLKIPWDGILQPWKLITQAIILSLAATIVMLMVEYYKVIYLDRVVARIWLTKTAVSVKPTHHLIQMKKGPSEHGLHHIVSYVLPGLKLVYLHMVSNHI